MRSFLPSLLLLVSASTVLSAPVAQSDEVLHARGDTPNELSDKDIKDLLPESLSAFGNPLHIVAAVPTSSDGDHNGVSDPFKGVFSGSVSH